MASTPNTQFSIPLLATLAATAMAASLGVSIASVLLPTLTRVFTATVSDVQWVVLIYLMSITIAVVPAGRLGDLFGPRRVLISGLVVFILASVLCATAMNLNILVAGRALQGFGGAILIALPMSMARNFISSERLGTAMGLLGTTSALGTALGPSLGGLLLAWGDWKMAFWVLAAIGSCTLLLAIIAIPKSTKRATASRKELDFAGTFVLVFALAAYALATSGGVSNIPLPPFALYAAAFVGFALFVIVETRAAAPLVPMALLCERKTSIGIAMNILISAVMMATLVIGPFFLAFVLKLNEALIGLVLAVGPVTSVMAGIPAGKLTDQIGPSRVLLIGLAQSMLGLLCLAFLPTVFGVIGFIGALILLTPGFQFFLAANNTIILIDADKDQRGRLSGLLGLSRNLGLMTGASAMPTVFVALLGTGNISMAATEDVARAFSMTFVVAAGLAATALFLAIYGGALRQRNPATGPQ